MKVIFLGTPSFSTGILEMLNKYYEVVLVVTKADSLGKHNKITESPVKIKAKELNLPIFQPQVLKDDYEPLLNTGAEILITAAYGQFIPSFLLNKFKYKINVHASLLPKRRGGAPIQRALIEGDEVTGISIMQMEKKMDAGVIYAQKELKILPSDNSTTLFAKLAVIGFSYILTKEDEIIDFNKNSLDLVNQIRGLALEPGAYFKFKNQPYKVLEARISDKYENETPGTIISLNKEFIVKTKDKALSIIKIKAPGKKELDIKNFLNGQRIFKEHDILNQ